MWSCRRPLDQSEAISCEAVVRQSIWHTHRTQVPHSEWWIFETEAMEIFMQTISHSAAIQISGGNPTPGYIDATEYAMLQDLWRIHAWGVAHGYSGDKLRYWRDAAIAFHDAAKQH